MAGAARSLRVIRSNGPAEGKSISEDSSEKLCRVRLQLVDLGDERAAADGGRLKPSEQVATRGERRNPIWVPTSIRLPKEDHPS
jgi:hypothetical protein